MWAIGDPIGPMENGTTYIVLPRMQPSNKGFNVALISLGSTQLLVGPASSFLAEQINVLSSTRATSSGSERAKNEFLRLLGFKRLNTPALTKSSQNSSYSAWEPSHH